MALTGKTGADAIFKAVKRICIVLSHYNSKLDIAIGGAVALEVISAADAVTIRAFLAGMNSACVIMEKLANYSGFNTNP